MKKIILTVIVVFMFCKVSAYASQLKFAQITDIHFSSSGVQQENNSRDVSKTRQSLMWAVRSLNNKGE